MPAMVCDRCKRPFDGASYPPDPETGFPGATAGYYEVGNPEGWGKFANPGERIVCDPCMFADPRYIAVYGDIGPKEAP